MKCHDVLSGALTGVFALAICMVVAYSIDNRASSVGGMLEENFVSSMIKAEGDPLAFFNRPIAGAPGVLTLLVWMLPLVMRLLRRPRVSAQFAK